MEIKMEHIVSIIIIAVIVLALGAVVAFRIINKKKGKSSCSCGGSCGACPMGAACHSQAGKKEN